MLLPRQAEFSVLQVKQMEAVDGLGAMLQAPRRRAVFGAPTFIPGLSQLPDPVHLTEMSATSSVQHTGFCQ
jgi:hypothetical protein